LILAYVLARVEAGKDREALKSIKPISGVKKARATYGTYDMVDEVSFNAIEELDEFVFDRLRKIPPVKETVTVVCSDTMS